MQGAATVVLLTISNIFMTFAWYGHLRFRSSPIWEAILFSWLIASLEYCFQVPANRIGSYHFTTAQLKIMQEVITLIVFSIFSVLYLKEQFRWNYLVAFVFLIAAVCFVFIDFKGPVNTDKISNFSQADTILLSPGSKSKEDTYVKKISEHFTLKRTYLNSKRADKSPTLTEKRPRKTQS